MEIIDYFFCRCNKKEHSFLSALYFLVQVKGLEPPRGHPRQILSLLRLPIPPHLLI